MNQVHMSHGPALGGDLWSTVDHGQRRGRSSPECGLAGAAAARSSPRLHQNKEEDSLVLTKVFGDRLDGEVRLTTEEREWWQSSSVVVRYRHREVEKVLA
jgi:hypothetical protein